MSEKRVSDTIAQQRKARKQFLELKKMQSETKAAPREEAPQTPLTFKQRLANFWFYRKWHCFAALLGLSILCMVIVHYATAVKPDLEIAFFTYTYVSDEQIGLLEDYLEEFIDDINGDGERVINIKNLSFDYSAEDLQTSYNISQKLQMTMSGTNTLLYITDTQSEKAFEDSAFEGAFGEVKILNQEFYSNTASEKYGSLPEDLHIYCRNVKNSVLEKEKNIEKIESESLKLLEELTK